MNVDGIKIREALNHQKTRIAVLMPRFKESCWTFEGEVPGNPVAAFLDCEECENKIAALEELQQVYNSHIKVRIGDECLSLSRCIKIVGGAGRRAKAWKEVALETGRSRYNDERVRDANQQFAKRTIAVDDALRYHKSTDKYASEVRSAISRGNTESVLIGPDTMDPRFSGFEDSLFD